MSLTVHRYWTGLRRVPSVSPYARRVALGLGLDVQDWDDATLPRAVREQVDALSGCVPDRWAPRHRANVARLALLHEHGGIWLDHDAMLLRVPDWQPGWVAWANGRYCTALMGFEAGDPRLALALAGVHEAPTTPEASGERMLAGAWADQGVHRVPLPFGWYGEPETGADLWAVHCWASGPA